jgi:hypothetical protein
MVKESASAHLASAAKPNPLGKRNTCHEPAYRFTPQLSIGRTPPAAFFGVTPHSGKIMLIESLVTVSQ